MEILKQIVLSIFFFHNKQQCVPHFVKLHKQSDY